MLLTHFEDADFQHALATLIVEAGRGDADADAVLATAARISDGDADAWVLEWIATAGTAWVAARAGDCPLTNYRHAITYYTAALRALGRSGERDRRLELWRRRRACWEGMVELAGGEQLAIPYEQTSLPGFFFRAPGGRRPLVLMVNGADAPTSSMWGLGGAAAAARGYHWATFDGPGQEAALVEQGLLFRPDWEAVLTPVLDALLARPEVDPARVAVIGIGQGGFWVPRALAFEHRPVAAVVHPGVVDVSEAWAAPLPRRMRRHLHAGETEAFDREVRLQLLFAPQAAATLEDRATPYGLVGASPSELYAEAGRYRLGDEVAGIRTPLLITEPASERSWPGQSRRLFDRLQGPRALWPVSADDREVRVFEWLDSRLS